MTAETLKPFITPQCADNFTEPESDKPRCQWNTKFFIIGLSFTIGLAMLAIAFGVAISNHSRVSSLEKEVITLNNVIKSMRNRLGINYLEDIDNLEEQFSEEEFRSNLNTLDSIPEDGDAKDIIPDDDEDDDDKGPYTADEDEYGDNDNDEDEDDDDYDFIYPDKDEDDDNEDALQQKEQYYKKYYDDDENFDEDDDDDDDDDDDAIRNSNEDNVYDDFEKYKDSKKSKQSSRKTRSISNSPDEQTLYEKSSNKSANLNATKQEVSAQTPHHTQHYLLARLEQLNSHEPSNQFVSERRNHRHPSILRQRTHRRRNFPMTKKEFAGESLLSAKSTAHLNVVPPTPAAHFHLNRKVPDRHAALRVDSYPGDMYIGHPSWTNEIPYEHYFKLENGVLTVREPGLYYVYAQVCYNNTHDQNGFVIFHGQRPFLQCLNTVPTSMPMKIHTCHTSGLIHLQANETIHLRDFHSDRNVILKDGNNRSYFGLMKI